MQAEGRRLADSAWRHHKYASRPNPPYFHEIDSIPAKARISRQIGIPLTRSGRQRKIGAAMGCLILILALLFIAGFLLWIK